MNRTLLLSSFILALSGCQTVTIKNRTACTVNGAIFRGATCAETITGKTSQLSPDDVVKMLELEAPNPNANPPVKGHAPAIFQTADDYGEETTELQVACRLLGDSCSYELQTTIENRKKILEKAKAAQ